MGSGFDDWVSGTSLQLQSIITAHTLNPFWILLRMNYNACLTNLYEESLTALNDVSLTNESLKSLHGFLCRLARIHGNSCKSFVVMKNVLDETLAAKQPKFYCWLRYLGNVFT
jgi:hypothetical protein